MTSEKPNGISIDSWEDHETLMDQNSFLELTKMVQLFKQAALILAKAQRQGIGGGQMAANRRFQEVMREVIISIKDLNKGEIQLMEDVKDCGINPSEKLDWDFFINIEPNGDIRVHQVLKPEENLQRRDRAYIIRIGDPKWFGLMDKIMVKTACDIIKKTSEATVTGDEKTRKSAMRLLPKTKDR
ncbi:MAG: hypothetical protein WC269_00645 [Candidatus Gracilibacteria bacterium]|jgi:hypothetical protein